MENKKYAFGVDVGGTTVKLGFFEEDGTLLKKWEIPTVKDNGGERIISDIAAAIAVELSERRLSVDDIIGVGMGIPGPVLEDGTVDGCVNLGWGRCKPGVELAEKLGGVSVKLGNDANVAALGEYWKGGGKGFDDVVVITLGTGVGGGIILHGKIVTGVNGAAGEIGHIHVVDGEEEACGCGKHGCLEQYCSATGVVRVARRMKAAWEGPTDIDDTPSCKEVFDAAKDGDQLAQNVLDYFGEKLARGCAHISAVINPQVFVFGGGVSKAGQIVIDQVRKYYKEFAFYSTADVEMKLAVLGNDAGIVGAAKLVID